MDTRGLRELFKTNSSGDDVYFTLTVHFPLRKEKEREIKKKRGGGRGRDEVREGEIQQQKTKQTNNNNKGKDCIHLQKSTSERIPTAGRACIVNGETLMDICVCVHVCLYIHIDLYYYVYVYVYTHMHLFIFEQAPRGFTYANLKGERL